MKRYKYLWTNHYDESKPQNGYPDEWNFTDYCNNSFTFLEWLETNCEETSTIKIENNNEYILFDNDDSESSRYMVLGIEVYIDFTGDNA